MTDLQLISRAILATALTGAASNAIAEEPATEESAIAEAGDESTIDTKIAFFSIAMEDTVFFLGRATVSTPVHGDFGASFDVVGGSNDDGAPLFGGAGRFYYGDTDGAWVGAFGSGTHLEIADENYTVFVTGAEGGFALGDFGFGGAVGFVTGDNVPDDVVGIGRISYRPVEDFRLSVGTQYFADTPHATFDVEYFVDENDSISLFGGGLFGDNDDWQIMSGLKIDVGGGSGDGGGGGGAPDSPIGGGLASLAVSSAAEEAAANEDAPPPPAEDETWEDTTGSDGDGTWEDPTGTAEEPDVVIDELRRRRPFPLRRADGPPRRYQPVDEARPIRRGPWRRWRERAIPRYQLRP